MRILTTGATGMVGQRLGTELVRQGHDLVCISRNAQEAKLKLPFPAQIIQGDLLEGALPRESLNGIDGIVHLMGENVASGRWSEARKKKIYDSRVVSFQNLWASLKNPEQVQVVVSASAIGYYAPSIQEECNENAPRGQGFLSQVCQDWEDAVALRKTCRTVIFRLGVILGPEGGALEKMREAFRLHVAGTVGSGAQWMSWVHVDDVVQMFLQALQRPECTGIYNAVAPQVVTNREFSKTLAGVLTGSERLGPPLPGFVLKLAMGEMSDVLLESQRVSSQKLQEFGFKFRFPDLQSALADCCAYAKDGYSVFYATQFIDRPRSEVFKFFSEAQNLEKITPEFLNFKIQNISTPQVQNGTLIDYTLKVHQVPVSWRTEISDWTPDEKFTDSQLKGPYREWIHTHTFEDLGRGTLMSDRVLYKLPLGLLGQMVAGAFVRGDVTQIFAYRRKSVLEFLQKSATSP